MAIGTPTYNGGATTNAGGTSFAVSPSTSIGADNYVLLVINRDNDSTTDGDNGEVTGVTDTQGNTWTKLKEMTNGQGAAAAGAMISVWGCRPSGTYGTTQATVTFGAARNALACYFIAIPIGAGNSMQLDGTQSVAIDAAIGFGSQTISGLASAQRAYISACCKEGNATTAIVATLGWTSFGLTGQNGPTITATNHIMYRSEYKVATSTGETSNPTWATSGDAASVMLALSETTPTVTLTGNNASEAHTSTTGAITQTQTLTGSGATETHTSTTGAVVVAQALTGNGATETHTSTTGAISQTHILTGNGATEAHTSATGAITQTQTLTGNGATEAHTSTTGAVAQTFNLSGNGATEAHTSTTGAIAQTHTLTGANSTQTASSPGSLIFLEGTIIFQLSGAYSTQTAGSGVGHVCPPPLCPSAISQVLSLPETIWDGGATVWDYCENTHWDLGVGTCPALGTPPIPDGSGCVEVLTPIKSDTATCTPLIEPRMLR